jgi:hypothetical protein
MVQLIPEGLRRMVSGEPRLETGTRNAVVLSHPRCSAFGLPRG